MAKIRLRTDLQIVVLGGEWGQIRASYGKGATTYVSRQPDINDLGAAERKAKHIYDDLQGDTERVVEGVLLSGDVLGEDGVLDLAA